jgi:integrase
MSQIWGSQTQPTWKAIRTRMLKTRTNNMWQAFSLTGHHQQLPVVAHLQGSSITSLVKLPPTQPPKWVEGALTKSTRLSHYRALARLADMPLVLADERAASAIATHLHALREKHDWTFATTLKNFASTQSALKLLPLYRKATHGIPLVHDPFWTSAMSALQKEVRSEQPRTPIAMTPDLFSRTYNAEHDAQHRFALLLMWLTCGRVGDILGLQYEDVTLTNAKALLVSFHRGKAVRLRGPYTVATAMIADLLPLPFITFDASGVATQRGPIFTIDTSSMLTTYRRVDTRMEAKSIRRGALQCLARAGVPNTTLMLYSGHTAERTLLRYLNWGLLATHNTDAMTTAGAALRGTSI